MQRAREDVTANGKTDRDRGKKCGRRCAVLLSAFQGSMGRETGLTGGWKRTIGPVGDQEFSGARTGMIPLEVSLSSASGRRLLATYQFSAKVSFGIMPNSTRYPGDFGRFSFTELVHILGARLPVVKRVLAVLGRFLARDEGSVDLHATVRFFKDFGHSER